MAGREHTYNTGRIRRADKVPYARTSARDDRPPAKPPRKKRKRKRWRVALIVVLIILGLGTAGVSALYSYADSILDPGEPGIISAIHNTPEEYKGDVFNLLVVGIDNEEGRGYGSGLGQTDMILYCNFVMPNEAEGREMQLNLLQIPRDSYVGDISGSNGKINSLMITGADKDNPINNLVQCISTQFKLPVDGYISLDMDALKEIVDKIGPIRVYVSQDMSYNGSSLEQGWQWMNGEQVEFFVRNRHGAGFERADIDRLDNQRHFYSALFRRFLNLTAGDIVKLMPTFEYFCSTDISVNTVVSLAMNAMNLEADDVMFCKAPGATDVSLDPTQNGRDFYYVDLYGRGTEEEPGLANLLNQYFRTVGEPSTVTAGELGLPQIQIPSNISLYPPNVQQMGEVQEVEGGADVNVEVHGEDG